ncbi:MAG: DegV family protein [Acidimicrobiia bacterium]
MIGVVTDSASDLPIDLAGHYEIEIVPLTIRIGNREVADRRDLTAESFWRELSVSDVLPETAAPGVGQFQEAYDELARNGADGIVSLCLSSRLSATYQSAVIAAERMKDDIPVRVVDSQAVSMALGFQVLEAARAAQQHDSIDDVEGAARAAIGKTGILAALDTLEFLKRGGRIGTSQAFVGGALDIKPLLTLEGGVIAPAGRVRTRSAALDAISDQVSQLLPQLAELAVLNGSADDLEALMLRLEQHISREDVLVADIGPVVGTHTGPGVVGIAFRLK